MLVLKTDSMKKIIEHSQSESPREACGVLAGFSLLNYEVTEVFCCINVDKNPFSAYTIAPTDLLDAINRIEEDREGLELIGFYHSHPYSGPLPSSVDKERATWDGFRYTIYSIPQDVLQCWRWIKDRGEFIKEEVLIT